MSGPILRSKNTKPFGDVDEKEEGIGQGKLYSPDHAIKINPKQQDESSSKLNSNIIVRQGEQGIREQGDTMVGKGVAVDIKNRMGMVKERLMEKLAAASVPSDALDNAKHFVETVIKDVTSAAQGLTKEALQRIKSHLADIMPSLSPSATSKMVDDAEKEANQTETADGYNDKEKDQQQKGKAYVSPASSLFSTYLAKPFSKL